MRDSDRCVAIVRFECAIANVNIVSSRAEVCFFFFFFFSSRRRHTRSTRDWSSDVCSSDLVRPEDLSGLKAFGEDYPKAERGLLYRGTRRELRDGIWIVPIEQFLKRLDPHGRIAFSIPH